MDEWLELAALAHGEPVDDVVRRLGEDIVGRPPETDGAFGGEALLDAGATVSPHGAEKLCPGNHAALRAHEGAEGLLAALAQPSQYEDVGKGQAAAEEQHGDHDDAHDKAEGGGVLPGLARGDDGWRLRFHGRPRLHVQDKRAA